MDNSKLKKLKELGELYKEGILTKEEFDKEKKKILEAKTKDETEKNEDSISSQQLSNQESPKHQTTFTDKLYNDNTNRKLGLINNKLIYFIATIIILFGVGVFIGLYQYNQNQIAYAKEREQTRLDSIAEVERLREIWRQDSIAEAQHQIEIHRQDSIAKASVISPEKLLNFNKSEDGYRYIKIIPNISDYLRSIGYEQTNKSTFYDQEGTDGTGPYIKYYAHEYKKNKQIVSYHHAAKDPDCIDAVTITMSSEKDAKKFIDKCIKMGFKFLCENDWNGVIFYEYPDIFCNLSRKGNEIRIDFYP